MNSLVRVGGLVSGDLVLPRMAMEIAIEGEHIAAVRPVTTTSPPDRTTLDFLGGVAVPGFIDLHTHFCHPPMADIQRPTGMPNRVLMARDGLRRAREWLRQGVTTARDVGTPFDLDLDLRDLLAGDPALGPRVLAAGRMLTMTGGRRSAQDHLKEEISGPDEARRWARAHLKAGADLIKLYCTTLLEQDVATYLAAVLAQPEDAPDPGRWAALSAEEIRAGCEEVHHAGCTVAAHTAPAFGIKLALAGGVDTVEHGSHLDDEGIALFLRTGATWVPTLSVMHRQLWDDEPGLPDVYARFARREWDALRCAVRRGYEAGVPIATGTDAILDGMCFADEVELLVACGLPPVEALRGATDRAAAALGRHGRFLGALQPGKLADMVILDGDPTRDIAAVRRVVAVIKAGVVVSSGGIADPPCVPSEPAGVG